MGGGCSTHGSDERSVQNFCRKREGKKDHPENLGVDGKIILEGVLGK